MSTKHMYAAVLHGIGQAPRYGQFPAPVAGEGEEVVSVAAAALKPSDRLMAKGLHYAPNRLPHVVGLDGVGRLQDGTRVAFMPPQSPYGGMAEKTLVRSGAWLSVPDCVDDVTAAAFANPGMAAWKTILWEGEVAQGQSVLVLGATGTSGQIASQLAKAQGARVVVAGRNQRILDLLLARGADEAIRLDRPHDELVAAIAVQGPYDLIADYVWGAPAEAVLQALIKNGTRPDSPPQRTRYIVVGMAAGEIAKLSALSFRRAPIVLFGSGTGREVSLRDAAAAYDSLLRQVAAGNIGLDIETAPLKDVERLWREEAAERRIVFIP